MNKYNMVRFACAISMVTCGSIEWFIRNSHPTASAVLLCGGFVSMILYLVCLAGQLRDKEAED